MKCLSPSTYSAFLVELSVASSIACSYKTQKATRRTCYYIGGITVVLGVEEKRKIVSEVNCKPSSYGLPFLFYNWRKGGDLNPDTDINPRRLSRALSYRLELPFRKCGGIELTR